MCVTDMIKYRDAIASKKAKNELWMEVSLCCDWGFDFGQGRGMAAVGGEAQLQGGLGLDIGS